MAARPGRSSGAEIALGPPVGDAPELAGPQILTLAELAASWLAETRRPATLVPVSVATLLREEGGVPDRAAWVGPVLEGYRAAWNTPHGERPLGRVTFVEWLRRR